MEDRYKHPIDLKGSRVVVAIAQLKGPLPDGKHKTVINDRETLAWISLEDMRLRLEKVTSILDGLNEVALKPDIVVFPEYSFPVQKGLAELQNKANKYGFIVIGGADTIWQQNSTDVFNQSPIVIPGRDEPIWITKRTVSKWEEGLVDEPGQEAQPLLTWEVDGREFCISTHICLDFSVASEDVKHGGCLFIVPMCSPDVMSFLGWADNLLRLQGGSATVLCNCVGEGAKGQSGVVAVNPGGKPFQAALELSATKEQVSVFEIDLERLSPPRKTSTKQKTYPLSRRYLYDLEAMVGGVELQEVPPKDEGTRKRGVINPAIFSEVLGKKMRMAFLNVPQYAEIRKSVEAKDYEVLAILGKEDVMVTHLADDRYDMIFDVTQAINWIGIKGDTVTLQDLHEIDEDNFPHFRVDMFYKVLGVPVNEVDRGVFASRERPFPNFAEIGKLFKLAERWEDKDVTDDERTRFLKNKWILDSTETSPGDINAVMTVRLQLTRSDNKAHLLAKFEQRVVPELMANSEVTSLYRGSSPGLGIDYVLRLSADLREGFHSLYRLIKRIHDLSLEERLKADTTTYIVVKRLAQLSLSKAILVTKLSRDKKYRDRHIIPHLSNDERVKLTYQSEKEQLEIIDLFRPVDEALFKIAHLEFDDDTRSVIFRRLTSGLFNKNFDFLREVHDPLQMRVERMLTIFIRDHISEDDFRQLKEKESIQSQRDKAQLSYNERIKVVRGYLEESEPDEIRSSLVKELQSTNKVRNAFVHADAEQRISLDEFTAAVVNYCSFIHDSKLNS
jgi:predicted amidohydrolase